MSPVAFADDVSDPAMADDPGRGRPVSATTARARAFVAERTTLATQLGRDLAARVADPAAFAVGLRSAFERLADPEYRAGQVLVAPGIGPTHGVRTPLQDALRRGFLAAARGTSTAGLLLLADRLVREPEREARWLGIALLGRTVAADPERSWQVLRRVASEADEWITVDLLAGPVADGIVREPYRWAELEQLVYAPSRWERRLVGSTVAVLPHGRRRAKLQPEAAARALALLGELIGDAEPDVAKALAWAYRSLADLDPAATVAVLSHEAAITAQTRDGHRAWVIRDALPKLPAAEAAAIHARLAGIRRRPGSPSTSRAAAIAADFSEMGLGGPRPEPPLT